MTNTAILAASALLLFAYLLDILGRRYRLPAVVLLIATGIVVRLILGAIGVHLHWVDPIVPVIGTLGLILIVLEGALDLTVSRARLGLIAVSTTAALLGFTVTLAAFTAVFQFAFHFTLAAAALAAIPFAVISSAVAIPSAGGLPRQPREFVIYESSLSDILGVLVFYAWLNANGSLDSFTFDLLGGGVVSLAAAALAALALYYFINQIEGHVRFLPLIAALICLYAVGKELHLSPLILVLVCGLLINNPHLITWHVKLRSLHSAGYDQTLHEFKGLVAELTFATKSFFFLLLGYWTDLSQMVSLDAWLVAGSGVLIIYTSRWLILKSLRQEAVAQLMWIAPRGLITVLLFLSANETGKLAGFPFGAVMLIVLATTTLTALAHRTARPAPASVPVSVAPPGPAPMTGTEPIPPT